MTEVIRAEGRNGQIEFDGATVKITREGAFGRIGHGRGAKHIPLRSLTAVQLKPAAVLTNGFIQLSVAGEVAATHAQKGARTLDAASDENAVIFLKKNQPDFERMRDALLTAISAV